MKKILSLMMVLVMVLAALTSCATGGTGEPTSATNTKVTLKFVVGSEAIVNKEFTINGDAPVVIDAVKEAAEADATIILSELGDKVQAVGTYKDCTLDVNGTDVSFYWSYTLNGEVAGKADKTAIKEGDVIEFVFTRGALGDNNKYQETPYDPATNEYYDPDTATTEAA